MNPKESVGASLFSLSLHRLKRHLRPPESIEPPISVIKPKRNVWCQENANRVSFLIDADAFFRAFAESAIKAKKRIFIIGWDTDSRTVLPRPLGMPIETGNGPDQVTLAELLKFVLKKEKDLEIYILSWDFALIFLLEREVLPGVKFNTIGSERLKFVLDNEHPFWASHHQKIVVIDDQVSFTGGLDLTQRRWDTPEHRGRDERRIDPTGKSYGPFHDIQICLEGNVSKKLGEIAIERWRIATGQELKPLKSENEIKLEIDLWNDLWPESAPVHAFHVQVGISRTLPSGYFGCQSQLREGGLLPAPSRPVVEVEKLYLDAIRAAKKLVYIENQYFTSRRITNAIAKRLRAENGPEFVVVLPRDQTGWIDETTMGLLRSQALQILRRADIHGRFKAYYPVVPDLEEGYVKVHSKLMIVDDCFVRIGSANLNSRSMGLDTECDVSFEAKGRPDVRLAISKLRRDLLGEHLGVESAEFEARFLLNGSLIDTIESFRGKDRTLNEIEVDPPNWFARFLPPSEWIDPHGPKGVRRWFLRRLFQNKHVLGSGLILTTVFFLLLSYQSELMGELPSFLGNLDSPQEILGRYWSWIHSWNGDKVAQLLLTFQELSWAPSLIVLGFVIGSLAFVPISAMILGVALVYPVPQAILISLSGCLLAAAVSYAIGRFWAFSKSRQLAKPWIKDLSHRLKAGGIWAVTFVRLFPLAPFSAVGIVAGGLKVNFIEYFIGSLLALLPGLSALHLLASGASQLAAQKMWTIAFLLILGILVFVFLAPRFIRKLGNEAW